MKNRFLLENFVDINLLQEVQDKFAQATGLAAITVDYSGNPITKYSNFSQFCRLIRKNSKWQEQCKRCDAHGGLEAARTGKPHIYICHAGLVDISMPIMVQGTYMGAIMAGQTKIQEDEYSKLKRITTNNSQWCDYDEIVMAYDEIEVKTYEKILAAAHMMFVIANYIVEKELINIIQEELSIKNLKLMEEVKLRADLEKSIKDSEIKALQSQLNPHFLFNVLNSISRLALIEKAERTQEITYCFSDLLRYTLKKKKKEKVTLGEEVEYTRNYLKIQTIRFGNRLQYDININEDLKCITMPFMILQPLVENSINHGLSCKKDGGHIYIYGFRVKNNVVIQIKDNGVGMESEEIRSYLKGEKIIDNKSKSTGLGLFNVNRRLIYYYGKEYSLNITSKLNKGTLIEFKLPYI